MQISISLFPNIKKISIMGNKTGFALKIAVAGGLIFMGSGAGVGRTRSVFGRCRTKSNLRVHGRAMGRLLLSVLFRDIVANGRNFELSFRIIDLDILSVGLVAVDVVSEGAVVSVDAVGQVVTVGSDAFFGRGALIF